MPRRHRLPILSPDSSHPTLTDSEEALRPRTRGDCLAGGRNEARPCPWYGCRHHLGLDLDPRSGRLELHADPEALDGLRDTCALGVADRGARRSRRSGTRSA